MSGFILNKNDAFLCQHPKVELVENNLGSEMELQPCFDSQLASLFWVLLMCWLDKWWKTADRALMWAFQDGFQSIKIEGASVVCPFNDWFGVQKLFAHSRTDLESTKTEREWLIWSLQKQRGIWDQGQPLITLVVSKFVKWIWAFGLILWVIYFLVEGLINWVNLSSNPNASKVS